MNVLIAEDDPSSRMMLQSLLTKWGYAVTAACDGGEAWRILSEARHPLLVILDWMMPEIEGPEIVRRLRGVEISSPHYIIIMTSDNSKNAVTHALDTGADDFIGKPFDCDELRARVAVGFRMIGLQITLSNRIQELQQTLDRVKQLEGIIPICMYCKKIRDDQDGWNQLERYITNHSEASFSHGICPSCLEEHYPANEKPVVIEQRDNNMTDAAAEQIPSG
jgi:sigma-B regulation protein RsbU (phosphoserine phosphatase)